MKPLRILLLADSHLGLDTPVHARVARRRRGDDFLANHWRALQPALEGEVDVVVHGGDVFDRPRVPASLAYQAFEPLLRAADRGLPVLIVPGNHERSRLPHIRFARHPNIHIFESPRTFTVEVAGRRIAFAGFPYQRRGVRGSLPALLEQTAWTSCDAELRFLCMHHCVEGATVGPNDFTFTTAADVVRHRDVPREFHAILSGHIHRQQVLTIDLRGRTLETPVFYPGSVERTAFAEMNERKGYMIVEIDDRNQLRWSSRELPARPMVRHQVDAARLTADELAQAVRCLIEAAPVDAVMAVKISGGRIGAADLRSMTPPTMNVDVWLDDVVMPRQRRRSREAANPPADQLQLAI